MVVAIYECKYMHREGTISRATMYRIVVVRADPGSYMHVSSYPHTAGTVVYVHVGAYELSLEF